MVAMGAMVVDGPPWARLVVREVHRQRLQVFATPDTIAMSAMSPVRVAWMAVVSRGVLRCRGIVGWSGVASGLPI